MDVSGLLIDIDGVLTVSWEPIDGSVAAFRELRRRSVPFRLATNTTTRTRAEIADLLCATGFAVEVEEILTAPAATASYLREHEPNARCFLLSSGDVRDDLTGVDLVEALEPADVVVLGGAGLVYTHEQLNHAFNLLLEGASFVAMHRNLYWRTSRGLELDTGAYVMALEAAVGRSPVVIGKPSPSFFLAALADLDLGADRVAMIGDDVENDVLGAQAVGMNGVLVRTGKYRPESVARASGTADVVVDSFADAIDLLL
ncbi:MAG: TIGR01458 family HAD-type hydrolase [Acidimicrobiia bacterium]|nr:TIGR01458 family HAD-type hydrolase [Acidimicrobiia bacterium]